MSAAKKLTPQGQRTIPVSTFNGLVGAINKVNGTSGEPYIISISSSITLESKLPFIDTTVHLTIQGTDPTIQIMGQGSHQAFIVSNCPSLTLQQLTLYRASSRPGDGCLGAGGGVAVASGPTVTMVDVSLSHCSAFGGKSTSGGSGGSGGTPPDETSDSDSGNGSDGNQENSSPESIFGDTTSGSLGVSGPGGIGGSGGDVGAECEDGSGKTGHSGDDGNTGATGGYGSGGGPGGGGGGGGAGGYGYADGYPCEGGSGGDGKSGGSAGSPGYGGGPSGSDSPGSNGQGPSGSGDENPGNGGSGGDGAPGGAGAGLGGGIFVANAGNLTIGGAGSIDGCEVQGGTSSTGNGGAAGTGIFLQGTGTLTFNTTSTYTVSDPITDEQGVSLAKLFDAPSGFEPGSWGIEMNGSGTLELVGDQQFCNTIKISAGSVDLTSAQLLTTNDVELDGGTLLFIPTSSQSLSIGDLMVDQAVSQLSVNCNGTIAANSLMIQDGTTPTLQIDFNPDGFSGKSLPILTTPTSAPIPTALKLTITNADYKVQNTGSAIVVTKN